jgi:hypothetical protein
MSKRRIPNEVNGPVRFWALELGEFTTAEMVRLTGFKVSSVQSVLDRLCEENLLMSTPLPMEKKKRGRPPVLYRMSEEPQMRLKLTESVQALLRPAPSSERPTSTFYFSVRQLIDRAVQEKGLRRLRLLAEAESDLELALEAEGGKQATEMINARLDYERGRIAYWRRNNADAREIFLRLNRFFIAQHDESMVRSIDEFLLLLDHPHLCEETEPKVRARHLLEILEKKEYCPESPVAVLFQELLHPLTQLMETAINAQAFKMANDFLQKSMELHKLESLKRTPIGTEGMAKPRPGSRSPWEPISPTKH